MATKKKKSKIPKVKKGNLLTGSPGTWGEAKMIKPSKKVLEHYRKAGAFKELEQSSRRKIVKKAARKKLAKKVIGKLGLPGKVAVGAITAYDIAKSIKKGKGKSCKSGQYRNKKGICVNVKGQARKQPKQ